MIASSLFHRLVHAGFVSGILLLCAELARADCAHPGHAWSGFAIPGGPGGPAPSAAEEAPRSESTRAEQARVPQSPPERELPCLHCGESSGTMPLSLDVKLRDDACRSTPAKLIPLGQMCRHSDLTTRVYEFQPLNRVHEPPRPGSHP